VTLAGNVVVGNMHAQLFKGYMATFDALPMNCSSLRTVQGPISVPTVPTVTGRIALKYVISSTTASFDVPLPGVLVGLYNAPVMAPFYDTCSTGSLLRLTMTDANG